MLFNSWAYLVFLVVVLAGHWLARGRPRAVLLLAASAVFYGWWDARFLLLMAVSIAVDFVAALRIAARPPGDPGRRRWLLASLFANLGILFVFKYFDFFSRSLAGALSALGIDAPPFVLEVVLPVGISFYTFQSMGYTIDVYRGQLEPSRNPLDFALYVSFFPQLVAGPIERADHLLPQLTRERRGSEIDWKLAAHLLIRGYYKKVLIADNLAPLVGQCLDDPAPSALMVALGSLAFAFQIYGDFSGYTDIARGSALLVGVRLRENFRAPYFATSPSDFWSRWHISLSTWLRDYLYVPLGGNRGGERKTYRNVMLVMLLGGLWHGAAWTFVVWGAFHGLLLVVYRLFFGPTGRPALRSGAAKAAAMAIMFVLTLIGWTIFRAESAASLLRYLQAFWSPGLSFPSGAVVDTLFLVTPGVALMILEELRGDELAQAGGKLAWWVLHFFMLGSIALFGSTGGTEFIYFQF